MEKPRIANHILTIGKLLNLNPVNGRIQTYTQQKPIRPHYPCELHMNISYTFRTHCEPILWDLHYLPKMPSTYLTFHDLVYQLQPKRFIDGHRSLSSRWDPFFQLENTHINGKSYGVTLPETNIFAYENGWLEYDRFLLGWPIFRCYVSFREGNLPPKMGVTLPETNNKST